MERKGLIRSRLADSSEGRGGRPRRYVEITAEGMAEARQSREALMNMWRGLDEAYDG
jgi:PadR family transcriptional regulator PadR